MADDRLRALLQPPARLLRIHGRVQGVGYRAAMTHEARRLGATGWVRNRGDGTVESLIQGSPEVLAALLAWARHGPPAATVVHIDVSGDGSPPCRCFEQLPTL